RGPTEIAVDFLIVAPGKPKLIHALLESRLPLRGATSDGHEIHLYGVVADRLVQVLIGDLLGDVLFERVVAALSPAGDGLVTRHPPRRDLGEFRNQGLAVRAIEYQRGAVRDVEAPPEDQLTAMRVNDARGPLGAGRALPEVELLAEGNAVLERHRRK